MKRTSLIGFAALATGCLVTSPVNGRTSSQPLQLSEGARYVAMGSSFASGAGLSAKTASSSRCDRSTFNYAHILANSYGLTLDDVSCGGATTANVLGPWAELPPQIDALTPQTALVTLTIGGNDVNYIGSLIANSCRADGASADAPNLCELIHASGGANFTLPKPTKATWRQLEMNLTQIVKEIRSRSPRATIVFIDYLTVLPSHGACARIPLSKSEASQARAVAKHLAEVTSRVAKNEKAQILGASSLSRDHDACSPAPWTNAFKSTAHNKDYMPYHPNRAGMVAIADALERMLF
ncbi:MAG: SGNH/GDSL hydrolase family protein [Novosphingobium sp.]|nr:SGNH/GDSL hydrolase family protein [Novosphingobium sp.]MCP5403828.1 SGNH/GDSL hydrolase family protein [Novosphingobium sp.]